MWVFYVFASLLVVQAAVSLRGGLRYLAYVRRELLKGESDFAPYASVIAPCRGLDQGLRENLAGLFRQDYPAYEIVFILDSATAPPLAVIADVRSDVGQHRVTSRAVLAGKA